MDMSSTNFKVLLYIRERSRRLTTLTLTVARSGERKRRVHVCYVVCQWCARVGSNSVRLPVTRYVRRSLEAPSQTLSLSTIVNYHYDNALVVQHCGTAPSIHTHAVAAVAVATYCQLLGCCGTTKILNSAAAFNLLHELD
jgi:hypothetical protein